VYKLSNPYRLVALATIAILFFTVIACRGIHGDTMVVVDEGETVGVRGQVTLSLNPATGKFDPALNEPGIIYVFRADKTIGGVDAKAGDIFIVDEEGVLQKAGTFDTDKTNDELAKMFGIKNE